MSVDRAHSTVSEGVPTQRANVEGDCRSRDGWPSLWETGGMSRWERGMAVIFSPSVRAVLAVRGFVCVPQVDAFAVSGVVTRHLIKHGLPPANLREVILSCA